MNLNQVTVPALDLERSVAFYRGLGLRLIVHSPPRYARFECPVGEATFSLHAVEQASVVADLVVYFECEDLDTRVSALQRAGYVFDSGPLDQPWRWREARLRDPSGNQLCLFSAGDNRRHPPWRIT